MPNTYFQFKQFTVHHDRCAMKVTTDACLFGAWVAAGVKERGIQNALDIGTGTGLLSLMLAQKNKTLIDAVEIDAAAAEQAAENIAASPWKDRIQVLHQDVLHWDTGKQYDCILSNPPFYENELRSEKRTKNMAHHDEALRLKDLVSFIEKHISKEGLFFLLLPAKRERELNSLLEQHHLHLTQKIAVRQTDNHSPFRIMVQGSAKKSSLLEQALSVKNNQQEYTSEFIALLRDYYLYL